MHERTKLTQFTPQIRRRIIERDQQCFFCRQYYHMDSKSPLLYKIADIMHVVNRSQGGLGLEQNGVLGCRYHHGLLDNGNQGLREEMLTMLTHYLTGLYPGWSKETVTYRKYGVTP